MILGSAARTRAPRANPMIAPLSRNRNYRLLWVSQALSEFGGSTVSIAFPLLALEITDSPATAGLVLGTGAATSVLIGLPAGALVDRWNRKTVMLSCHVASVIASLSLVVALLGSGVASVAHMVVVAIVFGVTGAMFAPAEMACLPNLVPDQQLSTAVSMNAARSNLAALSGTAVGGFLLAIGRFVPFAMDVLTRVTGFFALLFLRVPPRAAPRDPLTLSRLGHEMASGLRWMWRHRPIRVIALFATGLNLFSTAYFIIIIVIAQSRGASLGEIGIMIAMAGVGATLGAFIAPYVYRRLTPYLSIIGAFWMLTLLTPLVIFIEDVYLMGTLFAAMAFLVPTVNTTISTYQLLLTPDELRGRMNSVMGVAIGSAAAAGPALGGFLIEAVSDNDAVLLCAAGIGVVTVLGTISPTLRKFPSHAAAAEPDAVLRGLDLVAHGVGFRYGPHAEPVLRDVHLTVAHGEHLAVVGARGAGKSTLAAALAGLITPQQGTVTLDGVPVAGGPAGQRRALVALVPRHPCVLAGTLRKNVTYLAPEADDDRLAAAAEALGATGLFAGGLDAPATALSVGHRQLVALLRVYVSEAQVVVLDEATCHLDPATEEQVELAFRRRGSTLIVVAHRLSSATRADRVLLLDGDRSRLGRHDQLMDASAGYARMWAAWDVAPEIRDRVPALVGAGDETLARLRPWRHPLPAGR